MNSTQHTISLPPGAATCALENARLAELSDAQLAEVEFGPWEHAAVCRAPTAQDWAKGGEALLCLHHAHELLRLDKPGMVESLRAMPGQQIDLLIEALSEWKGNLHRMLALVETTQSRLAVACAVMAASEKKARKAGKSQAAGTSRRGGRPARA